MKSNTAPSLGSQDYRSLQAECKFLRMEKDLAVKMWEKDSHEMESAVLQANSLSSVLAVVQGRKKIADQKVDVIETDTQSIQIKNLQERLQKLRKMSELREKEVKEEVCCRNACQVAIQNVVEQLKDESKQLWQMQLLLGALCKQVQELHNSKNFWQCKALRATTQAAALKEMVREWRLKALSSQRKLWPLQSEIAHLRKHLHLQTHTMLYHETRNESDKRDKIDHPCNENCCHLTNEKKRNININHNIKRKEQNRDMPKRQPLLEKNVNGSCERPQYKRSEGWKKNKGVMFSKENNTRQDLHSRNKRSARCPLQNISNVIVKSPSSKFTINQ